MKFTSFEFLIFLPLVLLTYWRLSRRGQNALLLGASYVFYGWIHPWFCLLIGFSTILDYFCGLAMERSPSRKRSFLVLSIAGNLALLGTFKYFNFFMENFRDVLGVFGLDAGVPVMQVLLPVGISFYTFQSLSYTIDIHAGRIVARRNFVDFAVFVSLFTQLVAGPIERASRLLPQIEKDRHLTMAQIESGVGLIVWGYVKKLVIADQVVIWVDRIFELPHPSWILLAAGALAFAIQILADFSAYTDIARGVARLLGFDLVENFKAPYLATSPSDFWRRWHISFSSWIRDYLYFPLGGSKNGTGRFILATGVAMGLSGLWHGASWNFVIWGLYHGVLVIAYHLFFRRVGAGLAALVGETATRCLAVATMFPLTLFGWIIFRQQDFGFLRNYLSTNPLVTTSEEISVALGVGALSVGLCLPWLLRPLVASTLKASRPMAIAATWAGVVLVFLFGRETGVDFIYFAF